MFKANKEKREIPKLVNSQYEEWINKCADNLVSKYEKRVFPILFSLGLFDDEHIRKYLTCSTMEDIYLDAKRECEMVIRMMEDDASLNGTDVWRAFRHPTSPVETPNEESFIFEWLPSAGLSEQAKPLILASLSVKNHKISINRDLFLEASTIKPTERQTELYNFLSDFCEEWEKRGFKKRPSTFISFDYNSGKMSPSLSAILGITYLRKI